MIELELFYKIVESEIRRKHIKFLKNQKCLPSDQLPTDQLPIDPDDKSITISETFFETFDEFVYSDNPALREKAKRVKAFNKGIETALKVLASEYKKFVKRAEIEE